MPQVCNYVCIEPSLRLLNAKLLSGISAIRNDVKKKRTANQVSPDIRLTPEDQYFDWHRGLELRACWMAILEVLDENHTHKHCEIDLLCSTFKDPCDYLCMCLEEYLFHVPFTHDHHDPGVLL